MYDLVLKDNTELSVLETKKVISLISNKSINKPLTIENMLTVEQGVSKIGTPVFYQHHNIFNDEVYIRELQVKKNTIATGEIHKYSHIFILLKGKCKLITQDFCGIIETGFLTTITPMTKKLVFAYEDCSFLNIYKNPNNLKTDNEINEYFIVQPQEYRRLQCHSLKLQ